MKLRRYIRKMSQKKLMIVIPDKMATELGYTKFMYLDAEFSKDELILSKSNIPYSDSLSVVDIMKNDTDTFVRRKIIKMGANNTLAFSIPRKIERTLGFRPDTPVEITLVEDKIYIKKIKKEDNKNENDSN